MVITNQSLSQFLWQRFFFLRNYEGGEDGRIKKTECSY